MGYITFQSQQLTLPDFIGKFPEGKKNKHFEFLKIDSTDFNKILWIYNIFETQQHDTINFPRKNL